MSNTIPSTFNAISIGKLTDIDTVEGNCTAENAQSLVGSSFGGAGTPLVNDFVEISPVGHVDSTYNQNNSRGEQFSVDGGTGQVFDSVAVYNATITYVDGTTATYSAVLFQDVDGNTYLAPEKSANSDQEALEAGPIRSITLDGLITNRASGLASVRSDWDFVTCFARGTRIDTVTGPVKIEDLKPGDLIETADNGPQPLRWIGSRIVSARAAMAPILIRKGALGNTKDLLVSPQHRMLICDWRAELYTGAPQVLIAAKHLIRGNQIHVKRGAMVEYFHIMFDRHQLVRAAGILSESFHPGELALNSLAQDARAELFDLFPELGGAGYGPSARPIVNAHQAQILEIGDRCFHGISQKKRRHQGGGCRRSLVAPEHQGGDSPGAFSPDLLSRYFER